MVKRKFSHLSKYLKILWTWLSQNFLSLFMPQLKILSVKKELYFGQNFLFIFKKDLILKLKGSGPHWKDRESIYQVRQILTPFRILVALILGWICVKCFRVTKLIKQIKFEGVRGELKAKHCLERFPQIFI